MNDPNIIIDHDLIKEYTKHNRKYHFKLNIESESKNNIQYIATEIKTALSNFGYSDIEIVDMIVKELFHHKKSKSKESLWFCYGDILVNNLKFNIGNKTKACMSCGVRFEPTQNNFLYCRECSNDKLMKQQENKSTVKKICIDCGIQFETSSKATLTVRCKDCQKTHTRNLKTKKQQEYRERGLRSKLKIYDDASNI